MDDSDRFAPEPHALEWMIDIAARDETTARALLDMTWVADSVSDNEAVAVASLGRIARSAAVAESVIAMPWLADGISDAEADGLRSLGDMFLQSVAIAESVIALTWVADSVSDTEANVITRLLFMSRRSAYLAESVIALPWVADGVSDTEASVVSNLHFMSRASVAVVESIIALPWVADGVSDTEAKALAELRQGPADLAESVIALPWVGDSISDTEASVVSNLISIAFKDADAALQAVGMPFLQTLEVADVEALHILAHRSADELADLFSLPMLRDGITDDEAQIVALVGYKPDVAARALAPDVDATMLERRTVELPLAGEVDLIIVRTRPVARQGMDLFENAVREAESLMGEPFPARYVGLLYDDVDTGGAGYTDGISSITIRPKYDSDDIQWGRITLAHEVAHFYWFVNAGWINEGMAQLMASAIENRRVGTPIDFTYGGPCKFARTVSELEALPYNQYMGCFRWIGERLFVSLLRTLGEDAFWEGARRLYAASLDADDGAGIQEVRQAFGPEASDVIARWYEGR